MEQHQLVNLITKYDLTATADAGDFAAVATAAHAKTIVVEDQTRYSLSLIGDRLSAALGEAEGLVARRAFADTLDGAIADKEAARAAGDAVGAAGLGELKLAQNALGNSQLQLYQADRQATITELGAAWSADQLAAILALGITHVSPANKEGVPDTTTALDFEIAWIVRDTEAISQTTVDAASVIFQAATTVANDTYTSQTGVANSALATEEEASRIALDAANATFQAATTAAKATYTSETGAANAIFFPVSEKHHNVMVNLSSFEGTTAAEWQTRADELLASVDGNGA